jgi:hypothetical protein
MCHGRLRDKTTFELFKDLVPISLNNYLNPHDNFTINYLSQTLHRKTYPQRANRRVSKANKQAIGIRLLIRGEPMLNPTTENADSTYRGKTVTALQAQLRVTCNY